MLVPDEKAASGSLACFFSLPMTQEPIQLTSNDKPFQSFSIPYSSLRSALTR